MFDDTKKLFIRTKSVPTAAAIWLATGVQPRVLCRPSGDVTYEFDSEHEPVLQRYIRMKDEIDRQSGGRA